MTTPPLASTGIGSGLDVNAIIDKLMAIERRPLDVLARQQAAFQSKISAYGALKGVLGALQSSVASFSDGSALRAMSAVLSDTSVASVAAGSGAAVGTYSLQVNALAQAHKIVADGYASSDASVGTGTLTFAFGSFANGAFTANANAPAKTVTIASGQSSLAGVRDAVNAAKIGVSASIVSDGSANGQRLVFTSSSGAEMSLKVTVSDGDGNNTNTAGLSRLAYDPAAAAGSGRNMSQTVAAQNASLIVDGIAVTAASNVVSDAIAGVTLTLAKTTSGTPATLTVSRDNAANIASVEGLVKAYNEVQKAITGFTKFDPVKRTASVLTGDSATRSIQSELRTLVAGTIVSGTSSQVTSLAQIGVKTSLDGTLTFDSSKLTALMDTDPAGVEQLFSALGAASDALVSYAGATAATASGDYAVSVTQMATRGTLVGSANANSNIKVNNNDVLTATIDGVTATVTLTPNNYGSAAALAVEVQSKLNGASGFVAAGSSVTVTANGNILTVTSNRFGSNSAVTLSGTAKVSVVGSTPTQTDGVNTAGTIGGHAATGSGQYLTGSAGTAVEGLRLSINGGATGARGSIRFTPSFGMRLDALLDRFIEADGVVSTRTEGAQASVKALDRRKLDLEARLERVEAAYRRQYVALDATIAQLSTTSQYLSQQLANLPKPYSGD